MENRQTLKRYMSSNDDVAVSLIHLTNVTHLPFFLRCFFLKQLAVASCIAGSLVSCEALGRLDIQRNEKACIARMPIDNGLVIDTNKINM